jgi:hypothetical protein
MSRTEKTKIKRSLRKRTWIWMLSVLLVIGGLLYWEQVAWLYVLGTAALTILLIMVALSNLQDEGDSESSGTEPDETISGPVAKAPKSRGKTPKAIYSTE